MKNSRNIKVGRWIADLVLDYWADSNKQLPCRVDSNSGLVINHELMVDDIGDYAQYIWYLGELLGEKKYQDFAILSALNACKISQNSQGLFRNLYEKDRFNWYSNEDTILGLVLLKILIPRKILISKILKTYFINALFISRNINVAVFILIKFVFRIGDKMSKLKTISQMNYFYRMYFIHFII